MIKSVEGLVSHLCKELQSFTDVAVLVVAATRVTAAPLIALCAESHYLWT